MASDSYIPYFVLTETHLKNYHFDAEVGVTGYNIIRADRPEIIRGGVAIYMENTLIIDEKTMYADPICEAAMVYNKELDLVIVGVYRPPRAAEESFTKCLQNIQVFLNKHERSDVQILGDFNFPFINWETGKVEKANRTKSDQNSAEKLLRFMEKNLLIQLVKETTRYDKSILDLFLTNNDHAVHNTFTEKTALDTDHDLVHCDLLYKKLRKTTSDDKKTTSTNPLDQLNWNRADWDATRRQLSDINWSEKFTDKSVDQMNEILVTELTKVCTTNTPKYPPNSGRKKKIPRERSSLLNVRKRLNSKINYCKYHKPNNFQEKLTLLHKKKAETEIKIRDAIKKELKTKEEEVIAKIKKNPRAFYRYSKTFSKTTTTIGPLIDKDNQLQTDKTKMCNILQDQYKKAFSDPNSGKKPKVSENKRKIPQLKDITFTEEDIIKAINSIPLHAAPGPDKIPAVLLRECKEQLSPVLLQIWRRSLDTGEIPEALLKQTIVPIHKKESKAIPANYRPISLTSHLIKLFERVLREKIVEHLEKNHLLINNQHGFRLGRSCLTQLLAHIDSILTILESNISNADVIYLDLSKAFDKVNHKILIHKIESMGITGKLSTWLESFLNNRYQHVVIDGATSEPTRVVSGVPQGTVLGPILFIIYMNDINKALKHSILQIFADDSKIIKSIKNQADREKLMEDLEAVLKWTDDNSMQFNPDKFQLIQHGSIKDLKEPYHLARNIHLENSETVKDLGIHVSEDLTWDYHINSITTDATMYAAWILRTIRSRQDDVMLLMYKTFVRSRLEYTSPLWSPSKIKDISKVEAVQRSFTAKISDMEDFDYWSRLKKLKMFSLQRRRECFIIIHMWKILRGLAPNDLQLEYFNHIRFGDQCRRKTPKSKTASIRSLRYNYFSSSGPRLFNIIPNFIKAETKLEKLKKSLDSLIKSIPDYPPIPGYIPMRNSLLDWVSCIQKRSNAMKLEMNAAEKVDQLRLD